MRLYQGDGRRRRRWRRRGRTKQTNKQTNQLTTNNNSRNSNNADHWIVDVSQTEARRLLQRRRRRLPQKMEHEQLAEFRCFSLLIRSHADTSVHSTPTATTTDVNSLTSSRVSSSTTANLTEYCIIIRAGTQIT